MPPRTDLILFLDLETTGSDRTKDEIIEFGGVMVDATDREFPEIGHFQRVIDPSATAFLRMMDKKAVRTMHEKNGLLDEILAIRDGDITEGHFYTEHLRNVAELDIIEWLDTFVKGDTTHIPYGGSGTGHFDGPFLELHMPVLRSRLTYWTYDVGSMRRMLRLAGIPGLDQGEGKNHRALDDARFHAEEFRYYQRIAGTL
jgi:oligoribonuclease (3'-5' exoribonuclease)